MTTRRKVLQQLAAFLGLAATGAWGTESDTLHRNRNQSLRFLFTSFENGNKPITASPTIDAQACILTQQQSEGPFFLTAPIRTDITEGKPGLPFDLAIQIVAADGCTPVPGATIEIWHCDASGNYSGHLATSRDIWATEEYLQWNGGATRVPAINDERWLRGAQVTDGQGIARFTTIFPGWYEMRTPHIHFKIGGEKGELFTSQFYFENEMANRIYREHVDYRDYGESPYSTENDIIIWLNGGAKGLVLSPIEVAGGLQATAKVGIEIAAA